MSCCREIEDALDEVYLIINKWVKNLCPDCGAPIVDKQYFRRCSEKPKEHSLGDAVFYLKKIKEELEKVGYECLIY